MSGLSPLARECFAAVDAMVPGSDLVAIAEREIDKAVAAALAEAAADIEGYLDKSDERPIGMGTNAGLRLAAQVVRGHLT